MSDYDDWSEDEYEYDDEDYRPDDCLPPELSKCISYEIVQENEIKLRQVQAIQKLSEEFDLEFSQAAVFLIQNNWNPHQVIEKILNSTLQLPELSRRRSRTYMANDSFDCPSCYSTVASSKALGMDCGHFLCLNCYKCYLMESVNLGPESIFTKCPIPDCPLLVAQELFEQLLDPKSLTKYKKFIMNSFVDNRTDVKWCPSPNCTNAVIYPKKRAKEISCLCGYSWCFACGKETHRPLTCDLFAQWNQKLVSDNTDSWLLANTKKCPKCKNAIEKNLGCMHMTCKCGHQFCWLCMGDWNMHGSQTGGNYSCNKFTLDRDKGKYKDEESKRVKAAYQIKRFEHYHNRYLNHKASLSKALYKVQIIKDIVTALYSKINEGRIFDFFIEAAELIYKSKRSLAFTYALGYYLNSISKLRFFEFIQGELENNMIKLEELIEKDLMTFLNDDDKENCFLELEFGNFRVEVISLTSVVKKYFDQCLEAIEAGFPDVKEDGGNEEFEITDINFSDKWICSACTFANELTAETCTACNSLRLRF